MLLNYNVMKKLIILIASILFILLIFKSEAIDTKAVPKKMVSINNALIALNRQKNDELYEIRESSDAEIEEAMEKYGIRYIVFSKSQANTSVRYSFKAWFDWLTPYRYYKFSSTGYTEEDQVESIEAAIENNTKDYYHFCQKMDRNNWFYCQSQPN